MKADFARKIINFEPEIYPLMKRLFIALMALLILNACKSTPPVPVSELVKKVWSASKVTWDGTLQFDKTAGTNLTSYALFKLDLSTAGIVRLTEFDGNVFTGTYTVTDTQLSLKGLTSSNGAPSGTNGTLDFSIVGKPTATSLVLETSTAYIKASNKKVNLTLTAP